MKLNTIIALALLFLIPFAFFFPYIFHSPQPLILPNSTYGTDLTREILPTSAFIQQELDSWGAIPLWRPYILSGAPLAGHPVYPLLYPFYWMIAFLPLNLALNLLIVLHLGWAAAGAFLFLRRTKEVSHPAAFAGAMIFAFSPKLIAYVSGGHWSMTMAIAWLPWIWFTFHQFWQTEKWKWVLLLGICLSMQLVTDLRTFFITLLPLVFLSFAFFKKPLRSWLLKSLKLWGVAGGLALGLSAGQLLPFLELLAQSSRTALSFQEASLGSLHPVLLIGMLFPSILNLPEYYIFMGVSALVLGVIGLTAAFQKSSRAYLYLLIFAILMSLGSYTPIYRALYAVIPGFSFLRVPARWWVIVVFIFAVFAALGIDAWIGRWREIRKKGARILITLAVFYLAGFVVYMVFKEDMQFNPLAAFVEFLILCLILFAHKWLARSNLILVVTLFGLWLPSARLIQPISAETSSERQSEVAAILEDGARHGERSLTPYRYSSDIHAYHPEFLAADGYDSFHIRAYRDYVDRMLGCAFSGYSVSVPATLTSPEAADACPRINLDLRLARLLNVRYLLLPADHPFDQGSLVAEEDGIKLIDLGQGYGSAFDVRSVKLVQSQSCLEELENIDGRATVLVEAPLTLPGSSGEIQMIEQNPARNGTEFRVKSTEPFVLIRSEVWAPGWRAFDEHGQELEVFRADCALQGVLVEAGEHLIRFEYRPGLWVAGLVCSGLFVLGLAAMGIWSHIRRSS